MDNEDFAGETTLPGKITGIEKIDLGRFRISATWEGGEIVSFVLKNKAYNQNWLYAEKSDVQEFYCFIIDNSHRLQWVWATFCAHEFPEHGSAEFWS